VPLRNDARVRVLERTNVRSLTAAAIGGSVDLTVADLSFISLRAVLAALVACTSPGGDLVPMVKPQFELPRDRVGAGGVVRDAALRAEAVLGVANAAATLGLGVAGAVASPLPGPAGNVEFFLWLRRGAPPADEATIRAVTGAAPDVTDPTGSGATGGGTTSSEHTRINVAEVNVTETYATDAGTTSADAVAGGEP
jgi:23S rRNA (cytidine1920-2'-O)/16S rRNA (cytidine1409-2'-O)-methyltransferase